MKTNYIIIFYCLVSCGTVEKKHPENIIPKETFITILKEVHLAEATFNLNKSKELNSAKKILDVSYSEIYLTHNIDNDIFEETLIYYTKNPELLEEIYSKVLQSLIEDRSTLNP